MRAIFTHKAASIYDDKPEEWYHFPETYLRQAESAISDFIIYYEPGRIGTRDRDRYGRRAYVAVAQVTGVRPDPLREGHFYADIDPRTYVTFDRPVPFRENEHYYERQLRRADGATNKGAFGRAVRPISDEEFAGILAAGFATELSQEGISALEASALNPPYRLMEAGSEFERPIIERILSRPVRDEAFRHAVQTVYGATCAMTGIKILNGRGHSEVQAAHIRPVSSRGPDSIRNGLALSGTVHWMFDRGLISLGPLPTTLFFSLIMNLLKTSAVCSIQTCYLENPPTSASGHLQLISTSTETRYSKVEPLFHVKEERCKRKLRKRDGWR